MVQMRGNELREKILHRAWKFYITPNPKEHMKKKKRVKICVLHRV